MGTSSILRCPEAMLAQGSHCLAISLPVGPHVGCNISGILYHTSGKILIS